MPVLIFYPFILKPAIILHRNIEQIKSLGMKAGVAINPHTPVADLAMYCMKLIWFV